MDIGSVVKFLDRHPWASLATGVGLAAVSVARISRERRAKRELKMRQKRMKSGPQEGLQTKKT